MSRVRRRRPNRGRSDPLGAITRLARRRARWVVGASIAAVALLAFEGRDVERKLTINPVHVAGTASARAHEIVVREFGTDYSMVVMLRGPSAALEDQGRRLDARLSAMPETSVVSPWTRGAPVDELRPSPRVAALVVRTEPPGDGGPEVLLAPVRRQIGASVEKPVKASLAGFPAVIESLRKAGEEATATGELIAVPVLLVVLLLVFRSVLAALLPLLIGGAVVLATRGVLSLLLNFVHIDLFAVSVTAMMGLALGVDYSLLVVSRFREEREGGEIAAAVEATVRATTRSIVPAGSALILAMVVSGLLMPGAIGRSVALAVVTVALLSMLLAICVVPAGLYLLGGNLDRWSLPRREVSKAAPLRLSRRIAARPRAVIAAVIGLVLCASWGFTLESEATGLGLLPAGDPGRLEQEEVQRALGPGWLAPTEVIVNGQGTPITSPERLRALASFQRKLERDPGVDTVAGLREVESGAGRLSGLGRELAAQERGLDRLESGISRVRDGTRLGAEGLRQAAQGSNALSTGVGAASSGAGVLAGALQKTDAGSARLSEGLGRAGDGSGRLADGATKASSGAGRLASALARASDQTGEVVDSARLFRNAMRSGNERLDALRPPLQGAEERLATAIQGLERMTVGRSDPQYADALRAVQEASLQITGVDPRSGERSNPSYGGLEDGIEGAAGQFDVGLYLASRLDRSGRRASSGMDKLAQAAERLDRGLDRLSAGSRELSSGVAALAQGGAELSPALTRISDGADHLASGLGQLGAGADRLAGGLAAGAQRSGLLTEGLDRIGNGLAEQREEGSGSSLTKLQQDSPGVFRSPYLVLAGLDGSSPQRRAQAASLVNVDRGGSVARMLVIGRDEPTSERARATADRLEAGAEELGRELGAEVVVGGVTPAGDALNEALRDRAPLLRIALSLISLLILIPVMRAVTMPAIAALLNLLTISATFGLLSLLFNDSLLGGPGYVDVSVVLATMMVMFALAIDYEVFVFARMREEYVRTGSSDMAVENALNQTAHVVTGAALIMIAVFIAFSVSDLISIRNFGVAQAIGVFIDAFIVRLVVIPAVMGWLGERSWWMPRWLDRLMPSGR